jgi:hypothetical protein
MAAPDPSRECRVQNNRIHDTPQTLDVNRTAPGGIENSCVDSLISDNVAMNLGGPGFSNFANGVRYIRNTAINVGYTGPGSALGEADAAGFVVFDNGSGLPWYRSSKLMLERNVARDAGSGRTQFGYYEKPYHSFDVTFGPNDLRGMRQNVVVRAR